MLKDVEFASIMVQNLNNNLITAPELADLRKRLRNLESKVGCMIRGLIYELTYLVGRPDFLRDSIPILVP